MPRALSSFNILSASRVELLFNDGKRLATSPLHLERHLKGDDLIRVRKALHLREGLLSELPPWAQSIAIAVGVIGLSLGTVITAGWTQNQSADPTSAPSEAAIPLTPASIEQGQVAAPSLVASPGPEALAPRAPSSAVRPRVPNLIQGPPALPVDNLIQKAGELPAAAPLQIETPPTRQP